MKKTTNILVPVDFSPCSENALKFAIQLADEIKGKLQVLHVPHFDSGIAENPVSVNTAIKEQLSQASKQMKNFIGKVIDNVGVYLDETPLIQTNVEWGETEPTIRKEAAENEIDYIIMGTQGERNILNRYLGTMASNVIKNAPCSVIVIPENAEFKKKMDLGYATDFSAVDPSKIGKVVALFAPFQPSVKCIHFNKKQVDNTEKIKEFRSYFALNLPKLALEIHTFPVGNTAESMNFFIENQDINMLVMYKPKRTFFEALFHKSYTQKMAKHTNIPLLVLK